MLQDEDKRQNILKKTDHSCFIEAGAGAGKTSLIVDRIIEQLKKGTAPGNIAAITFTKKATGELYDRIAKKLTELTQDTTLSNDERDNLKNALLHLSSMQISTIHSFCSRLLRENAIEAKLPVDFTVVEDADAEKRAKKYFYKWHDSLSHDDFTGLHKTLDNGGMYLGSLLGTFLKAYDLPQDVQLNIVGEDEIHRLEKDRADLSTQLDEQQKELDDKYLELIKEYLTFLEDEYLTQGLIAKGNRENTYYENAGKSYQDILNIIGDVDDEAPSDEQKDAFDKLLRYSRGTTGFLSLGNFSNTDKYGKNKNRAKEFNDAEKGKAAALANELDKYKEKVSETLAEIKDIDNQLSYYELMEYVLMARDYYQENHADGMLTDNELIERAYDLTQTLSEEVKTKLRNTFDTIYVDEFQDTDHIQAELIWNLVTDKTGKLRDGALVVVGDPKQSIYRFRGAEPEVFFRIKERMQQAANNGAKVIVEELCDNYRSNENMIRWFNDNYSKLFGAGNIIYSAMNYDDNTLSGDEGVISGAYYYKAPVTGKNYDEKCRAEAEAVVGIIQKLMKERKLYAKENGTRQKRDIRYSDFLILMRNTTDMNIYLDVFRENSIPVNWAGKEDVSGSLLLRKVQVVLRGLLHPYDWKESTGAKNILGDNKYTELMDATGQMDLNGKLQYLCDHLSYLVPEVSDAQEETTLRTQLNQMVETLYDAAGDDPAEVLDALSEYPDKPIEYELPLTEGEDAVRLMNVHKAKGLEGKIVILLNRRPEKKTHSSYLSVEDGKYIWHGSIAAGVGNAAVLSIQNIDGSEDQKDCENQEQAENLRLEYVAGTRAEEALIVMSELSPDKRCFFGGCNPDTGDGYEYDKNYIIPPKEIEEDKSDNQTATKKVEVIKEYSQTIPAKETNLSPSSLEHQESETGRDGKPAFTEDRPRGNVFGTVMHRAFELSVNALRDSSDVKGTVEIAVRQAIIENYEELEREGQSNRHRNETKAPFTPQEVYDFLVEKIQYVLNEKGLLNEIKSAQAVYTELPFSFYKKGSDNTFFDDELKQYLEKKKIDINPATDVWINGSSDLVIRKADGTWLIIDYKSDQKKDGLSEQDFNRQLHDDRYAGQLLLYRKALAEVEDGVKAEDIETKIVDLY